jgi:ribonuclease-3
MNQIQALKNSFQDKKLFDQALTHRSWVNEHPKIRQSNERLEFLGDAVLEYIVSSKLYKRFPNKEEGFLTALRSNLVNTHNLSAIARKIGLGNELFLSKGELEGNGKTNPSLLADTFEAIVGAIYLDQGLKATQDFINRLLLSKLESKLAQPLKDPKSRLQELVQAQGQPTPKYKVTQESGADHAKRFVVEVVIAKSVLAQGIGKNKAQAQQNAARVGLEKLAKKK